MAQRSAASGAFGAAPWPNAGFFGLNVLVLKGTYHYWKYFHFPRGLNQMEGWYPSGGWLLGGKLRDSRAEKLLLAVPQHQKPV